jgi:hypothetical protein
MQHDLDVSPRRQRLRAMIAEMQEAYPLDPQTGVSAMFTTRELLARAEENREVIAQDGTRRVEIAYPRLREQLSEILDPREHLERRPQQFGKWLRSNAGVTVDGMRLERVEGKTWHDMTQRWQLTRD